MPVFNYKATDSSGKVNQGTMAAPNEEEVATILRKQGMTPIKVRPDKGKISLTSKLPEIEKITLCRYLATMLTSGVSLTSGLPSIKKEAKNPLLRQIIDDLIYSLERGQPLSTALSNYPKVFDKFFLTLVHSGEVSGTLADSLKYLEKQLRADYSLNAKIKGALSYPVIVVVAMLGIGFLMFFFVMPQIAKVFLTMTIPLPAFTKTVFSLTLTLAAVKFQIIASVVILGLGLFLFLRRPAGKRFFI